MKPFLKNPSEEDRRAVRRWTLIYLGLFGPILAGFMIYLAFDRHRDANYAAIETTVSIADTISP